MNKLGQRAQAGMVRMTAEAHETTRPTADGPAAKELTAEDADPAVAESDGQSGPGLTAATSFEWDEEESAALRQARKDAELTASADSVRAYLKQIGKVALLNAEEEVELAKRIEAGLYATQIMSNYEFSTRDTMWIFSQSGINAVVVEAALYAKKKGMKLVATTMATSAALSAAIKKYEL